MSLSQCLTEYISACFTGLWVESHEHEDALREIAQMCHEHNWRLATFDLERGLQIPGSQQAADAGGSDPLVAIRTINALASPESSAILCLVNFHRFLQSAEIVQALIQQITHGKQNRTFVVILSPTVAVPLELEKLFVVVTHDLPGREQLEEIARGIATEDGELPEGDQLQAVLDAAADRHAHHAVEVVEGEGQLTVARTRGVWYPWRQVGEHLSQLNLLQVKALPQFPGTLL